ncbi:hypothetical protein [Sulfurisphaera tokodaii]|uniref:Uncharacterized protein n=2 Tax=Sulfurisphaera tokodaii TaxID=111955 RepID=F9VNH8_SULTO|nr:hypothetical protein [Sulfurisphaera tokodaii]BAK54624.1 hypothetical protein STK_16000 [Sulfurisphaera tokodaii str. 7]HII73501.1 hypothetical protein [Sulfurisphaera tokodaii]
MNKWKLISIILIGIIVLEGLVLFISQHRYITVTNLSSGNSAKLGSKLVMAVSSPEYRSTPLIGNYPFVINSGILTKNLANYTLIIAYVDINLSKAKVGESFMVYPSINVGSNVPVQFFNNPILNVTIVKNTIFSMDGSEYLNFSIKVNITALNSMGEGGITTILDANPPESTALSTIYGNTLLLVGFHAYNSSVIRLEFYVAPNTVS